MSESLRFDIRRGGADLPNAPIARLAIEPGGRMTVLSADEIYQAPIQDVVDWVNQLETFRIKVPGSSGEPGAIAQKEVTRNDADLIRTIQVFLDQKYDLQLEPESIS